MEREKKEDEEGSGKVVWTLSFFSFFDSSRFFCYVHGFLVMKRT